MADINITQLTSYTDPKSTDELPIVDLVADVTKRVTLAKLLQNANPGTAAAPGITFDNRAANTGIYSQTDYQVGIATNGVSRIHCRENGNVGINKIFPTAPFDVIGNTAIDGDVDIASGKVYKINGSEILSATALAGAVKITTTNITDGTIVNADISPSAEIAVSKLADGAARQVLQTDAAGTGVEWTNSLDLPGTLDVTGNATFDTNVTVAGDLTVNGTTTTINTQDLLVKDKNVELGSVASPTDVTADGGGITLKGTTDKTINWVDATDAWTFSEHIDLASAKEYRIAGAKVLDATSLGGAVVSSSLTSVGTISSGTWQGTAIDDTYLATITTAGKVSNSATTADSANTASAIVARDASGNFTAGTITAALTGNASTATALQTARTIGGVSFDGTANINLPGVNTAGNQDTTGNAATVTTNADLTGDVTSVGNATSIASGVIVDADVNASAAIAGTKISPDFGSQDITTSGDINLDDGGSFQTTLQLVTPTAARAITFPDATGTVGLVAGSTGQIVYNNAGAYAGTSITFDATTGTRFTLPFGYGTGAGGTVTQATSKSTGATLNTRCGTVTMNAAELAADTAVSFTLTNSQVEATDMVMVSHASAGTFGAYVCDARAAAGSASVVVRNVTAGALSEAIVLRFIVIKASTT
jgi:hypothetical protein